MDYLDRYIYKEISIYDLNYEVLLLDIYQGEFNDSFRHFTEMTSTFV